MSHDIRVLCRPEVGAGFRLAGLRTVDADSPREAGDRLGEIQANPEIGVILLEDLLYDRLSEDIRRAFGRRALPMIVPFPSPSWGPRPEGAEAYIIELLRQVVGYRVRLR